ncbi:MAG: hypothetical protein OXC41_07955, partial [Gammaproteobacteria bacterium]|nr:hypothetical protein [Gammaproteobacteria bacterium]
MASDGFVIGLRNELKKLQKFPDTEQLICREEWGEINFERIRAEIDEALSIAKDLANLPLEEIPKKDVEPIRSALYKSFEHLQQVEAFRIALIQNPRDHRDIICTRLEDAVHELRTAAIPSILYLKHKHNEASIAQNVAELEQTIARTKRTYDEAQERIVDKGAEIEGIVATAREAAASIGVG